MVESFILPQTVSLHLEEDHHMETTRQNSHRLMIQNIDHHFPFKGKQCDSHRVVLLTKQTTLIIPKIFRQSCGLRRNILFVWQC